MLLGASATVHSRRAARGGSGRHRVFGTCWALSLTTAFCLALSLTAELSPAGAPDGVARRRKPGLCLCHKSRVMDRGLRDGVIDTL